MAEKRASRRFPALPRSAGDPGAQAARPKGFVVTAGYGECGPGYIPTEQAWREGDTNLADWCWVDPGSEERMRKAFTEVLK